MSKEIAQAVGGKKIAFLFAILAAFAVFATLGSRLETKQASAIVTVGTLTTTAATVTGGDTVTLTLNATNGAGVKSMSITAPADILANAPLTTCTGSGTPVVTTVWPATTCLADQGAHVLTVSGLIKARANGAADATITTVPRR